MDKGKLILDVLELSDKEGWALCTWQVEEIIDLILTELNVHQTKDLTDA